VSDEERQPRTVSLKLSAALIARLDALKGEYGLRSRGAIVERLLNELFAPDPDLSGSPSAAAGGEGSGPLAQADGAFDERGALVLVNRGGPDQLALDLALRPEHPDPAHPETTDGPPRNRGIDLPGFVRRQSDQ